ncbi:hypothetical protein [Pontibacter ruber]|uniref:Lipoprotein n=1 Tax=Pontibacter ruber TaxID=1343895 RepID=A0ABW5CR76_9BACT|nr:hypothetical protein [Pontibacter ruber]
MKRTLLFLVLLAGFVVGCDTKTVEPDLHAAGYDYYPLNVGDFRIYDVTNIFYRNNVGDTTRFQLRERVDTTFTDQTNTLNYKIIRSIRPNANSSWRDDSVIVVTKSVTNVILSKDNTKWVKLVFPVVSGKTWKGDAYNSNQIENKEEPKENYRFSNVGEPFTAGNETYPETATVIQGTPSKNPVQLDDRKEVYAHGIGMVYRLFNRVVYCRDTESVQCPYDAGYKLNGHERIEVLSSYGTMK